MVKVLLKIEDKIPYKSLIYRDDTKEVMAVISIADLPTKCAVKLVIHDKIIITEDIDMEKFHMTFGEGYLNDLIGRMIDLVISYEDDGKDNLMRAAVTLSDLEKAGTIPNLYISSEDADNIVRLSRIFTNLIRASEVDDY
jgi:hypothetical protein